MAKGKGEIKGWITKNGVHIPIYGEYTVRGGVEPKAKGSKFKGGKKKKVDTSTTMGKTTKELEDNLKKKGLVLESADKADMTHKDFNDEKVTLYDNDGNVYKGTYNRYQNGDREIVNIEKDRSADKVQAGQVEGKGKKQSEDIHDQVVHRGDYVDKQNEVTRNLGEVAKSAEGVDFSKTGRDKKPATQEERNAIIANAQKKWFDSHYTDEQVAEMRKDSEKFLNTPKQSDDKYADRDWNKDVDDAKRYGYSEQTEEGKKPVTKAEEGKEKKYASKAAEMRAKGMSPQEIEEAKQAAKDNAREKEFQRQKAFAKEYWDKEDAKARAAGKEPKGHDTILDYDNAKDYDASRKAKAEAGQEKDKYANRDWNKDVDDAKRYGYSEQTEEGKKPVTKAEEKKPTSFQEQVNDRFKTKREWDEIAKNAGYKDSSDPEFQKNADDIVAKNKQESSSSELYETKVADRLNSMSGFDKDKVSETSKQVVNGVKAGSIDKAGAKAYGLSDEDYASLSKKVKEQESSSSSFSPESSAKAINDMARRRANGGGKNDDWKIANQTLESAPAGTTMIQTGDRGVKFQYTKGEDGKWHSSAGSEYDSDSKKLSMSWVGESGPRVEFTTSDKALSNEDIKASHDAATSGRLNQALGLDRNNRPIGNRSTRKVDTSTPTRTKKQDSLSASMNERSRIRGEFHAKDKAMKAAMPTTVSGLRSAYADATGSMKSKIAAELRRKGYSLVGGKWVKGRKE